MTAPDESGINKDCTEKSTDWIATAVKRCTDVLASSDDDSWRKQWLLNYFRLAPAKWQPTLGSIKYIKMNIDSIAAKIKDKRRQNNRNDCPRRR